MKKNLIVIGAVLLCINTLAQSQEAAIDEVTIAAKAPQQLYTTGKNVILISAKDLEKYKGESLTDVLDAVAGFQISGNFNNQAEPKSLKIRGGSAANVLILLDGIPLKDVTGNDYTASDLRLLALENVESIEVLNGASSVLYGSNATVSVINIKTKKSAKKSVEGVLSARGGSFGTFAQNALLKGNVNGFYYQISGFNEKSDGLSSAIGENFDKDGWEKQNLAAILGFQGKGWDVSINSGWNHNLYLYDYDAFTDGNLRGNDRQFYLGGSANFGYKNGKVTVNVRHSTTDRISQDLVGGDYQKQYQYKGDNSFAEIFNAYHFSQNLTALAGLQYEKQSMAYLNMPYGASQMADILKFKDTNATSIDPFLNVNYQLNFFHLDAGVRLANHSKFGSHLVYSVNPYYLKDFGGTFFKVGYSYATAFIAPTLYQNFGALPYTLPNFDLKPATNDTHEIDLSIGKSDRSLVFTASAFMRNEKDIFTYEAVDPKIFTGHFINLDANKVKGFEAGIDYRMNRMLRMGGNFSYVEKNRVESMLRQPRQRANAFLEIAPFSLTKINLLYQFVGKRPDYYYDTTSWSRKDVTDPAYGIFNLNISQKIQNNLEMFANVGNLLNKSYIDVVGYTTRPRNYTVVFSYRF